MRKTGVAHSAGRSSDRIGGSGRAGERQMAGRHAAEWNARAAVQVLAEDAARKRLATSLPSFPNWNPGWIVESEVIPGP
jgi:hypothetical protein